MAEAEGDKPNSKWQKQKTSKTNNKSKQTNKQKGDRKKYVNKRNDNQNTPTTITNNCGQKW